MEALRLSETASLSRQGSGNNLIYAKARFGHGLLGVGMGLGNRLFPWARYRIFVHMNHAVGIAPVWVRPAISQLWRGGTDFSAYLRQIVLFGLFKRSADELGVVRGNLRILFMPRLAEPADFDQAMERHIRGTVIFEGWQDSFARLNGWNRFLLDELRGITRKEGIELADSIREVPIGICVRCGNDFREPDLGAASLGGGEKTPIRWFVRCLSLIRQQVGADVPAYVVSDGTAKQLEDLLRMPNVAFVRPGSAISDLLVLAKARVLLVSGASSFAAWGSFLGEMPTISHLGQPLSLWEIKSCAGQYVGEFDPDRPSEEFITQAVSRLTQPSSDGRT